MGDESLAMAWIIPAYRRRGWYISKVPYIACPGVGTCVKPKKRTILLQSLSSSSLLPKSGNGPEKRLTRNAERSRARRVFSTCKAQRRATFCPDWESLYDHHPHHIKTIPHHLLRLQSDSPRHTLSLSQLTSSPQETRNSHSHHHQIEDELSIIEGNKSH